MCSPWRGASKATPWSGAARRWRRSPTSCIEAGNEVGLETPGERLRPAAGSAQERRILRALAWVGFEEQREKEEQAA